MVQINIEHFSAAHEAIHSIIRLTTDLDITSYDVSYLELAIRLGATLATNDKKLTQAAEIKGVITAK